MSAKWFCKIGDRQYGPLTAGQLKRMAERGQVTASSLLRREDATDWVSATMVKGLLVANEESSPSEAQKAVPVAQSVSQSTANQDAISPTSKVRPKAPPRRPKPPPKVATPVASLNAASTPLIDVASDDQKLGKRRNNNGLILLTVGAFVCGLVVVASAGYLAFHLSRNSDTQTDKVAETPADSSDTTTQTRNASGGKQDSASDLQGKEPTVLTATEMLNSVKKWRDLSKFRGAGIKSVVVQIASVRLGSNSSAIAVDGRNNEDGDPALDLKALGVTSTKRRSPTERKYNDPEDEPTETKSNSIQQPKFVFVMLSVSNQSAEESVTYASWNGTGQPSRNTSAVLVDDQGNECPLVPRSEMAADKRLGSNTLVPSNGQVADVLVFRAPNREFKHLRLVLPYEAVGQSGVFFGFEIPRDVIVVATQSTPQKMASGPKPRDDAEPSIDNVTRGIDELDGKAKDEKKAETNVPPVAKKVEERPPSIDELNRQFEELEKKKKSEVNQKKDD